MNYYKILEVDKDASPEVIRKAYRVLSMKFHPDKQTAGDPRAAAQMRLINQAYSVLSDSEKRSQYDMKRNFLDIWLDEGLIGLTRAWLLEGES